MFALGGVGRLLGALLLELALGAVLSGADVLAALLPALAEALASGGLASNAANWGCTDSASCCVDVQYDVMADA